MNKTWWRKADELDEDQKKLVAAGLTGNYIVLGPPGCGKTNILALRGSYLHRAGQPNFVILSFTRTLTEFISSGVGGHQVFPPSRVSTLAGWTLAFLGANGFPFKPSSEGLKHDEARQERLDALKKLVASGKVGKNHYQSILLDEVQDCWGDEVRVLSSLTPRLFVVGDSRQRIYDVNEGIDAALAVGCVEHRLKYHYRLGRKICAAADKVLPDVKGDPLRRYSQYNEKALPSRADRHQLRDRKSQFEMMLGVIRTQLRAYPDEWIGVIAPKRRIRDEVAEFLFGTDVADKVKVQHEGSEDRSFETDKPICVMVGHSSKGTEFRAVHFVCADEIPYFSRELAFTVLTRAKTALDVYHTGPLNGALESAFVVERIPDIDELFA